MSGMNFVFAFDGADGCGKTTISQLVYEDLMLAYKSRGFTVFHTRMPGGTNVGAHIRQMVKNPELSISPLAERLLFAADTAEHFHQILGQFRDNGLTIHVVDRWSPVTDYMYGIAGGIDPKTLKDIRKLYMSERLVIYPDVLFIVDVAKDIMLQRLAAESRPKCRIEKFGTKFHSEVWEMYRAAVEPQSLAYTHCQSMSHTCKQLDNRNPSVRTLRDVANDAITDAKKCIESRIENTRGG